MTTTPAIRDALPTTSEPGCSLDRLVSASPLRIAYADPPYIGQARKHYAKDSRCAEVNHRILIEHLREFDGWALSCTSNSLSVLLPMCAGKVRVAAWVKTFCAFKKGVYPAYAWEPVIYKPARTQIQRGQPYERDWVGCQIRHRASGTGTVGSKPAEFCYWLFRILNMRPTDQFHDLFPGSGAVQWAWDTWRRQMTLFGANAKVSE